MPAAKESQLEIRKLGVLAGGGVLPERLLGACDQKGIEVFIVGLEGNTDPALLEGRNHIWIRLGSAGQVIKVLKSHQIKDIVLIGNTRRPSLGELIPDFKTVQFIARIGMKAMGDNDLLSACRQLLEEEGFRVHGVHKFVDDLLAPQGPIGKYKPSRSDQVDIDRGVQVVHELGKLDIGQSVIVQEGIVLGVEAAEGTDELMRRCRDLKRKGRKGVLVKLCKPGQDTDLDLPTIGPRTLEIAAECELAGIVVQGGKTLVIDREMVADIADRNRMFVIGT